jgi:hypothetical protein
VFDWRGRLEEMGAFIVSNHSVLEKYTCASRVNYTIPDDPTPWGDELNDHDRLNCRLAPVLISKLEPKEVELRGNELMKTHNLALYEDKWDDNASFDQRSLRRYCYEATGWTTRSERQSA